MTHEGARHLDDVLDPPHPDLHRGLGPRGGRAPAAAALMAERARLGRGPLEDEVDHYLRRVEAERQSQQALTDQEADEARVRAPDIV